MTETSASSLKSVTWFPKAGGPRPEGGAASTLGKLAVGGIFGLLLFLAHKTTAAIVVWSIGGGVAAISLASAGARRAIDGALARFGRAVGSVLGTALLGFVYVVVVTPTRYLRRAMGADDLHLRDVDRPSYWLPCDTDARKAHYVGAMFATEVRAPGGRPLRTALVVLLGLFVLSEGILRSQGFGHTVLYVADVDQGYYPQGNVNLVRYGGVVRTNSYGMRSPDVTEKKPPGTFRILMLGDSTLYGGSYVDQEEIYASRLRKTLNGLGLPGPVEVLAMGCNGWGPFHEHGFVRKVGVLDADVTMIQLPIDDVNRSLYGLMSVPFFPVQSPPRIAWEEILNHLMWRYRSAHSGMDEDYEAKQSQRGIAEYGALVDDLQKRGTEVMMFILPTRGPGMGGDEELLTQTTWREELQRTVAQRGVTAYFARGAFANKGKTVDEIYYDGVHLNPPGHQIYAEFIHAKLTEGSARWKQWAGRSATAAGTGRAP